MFHFSFLWPLFLSVHFFSFLPQTQTFPQRTVIISRPLCVPPNRLIFSCLVMHLLHFPHSLVYSHFRFGGPASYYYVLDFMVKREISQDLFLSALTKHLRLLSLRARKIPSLLAELEGHSTAASSLYSTLPVTHLFGQNPPCT